MVEGGPVGADGSTRRSRAEGSVAAQLAQFGRARVARLATVGVTGAPHLVPVTFALVEATVVMAVDGKPKRTTELQRIRNLRTNRRVTLLVDQYDDDWSRLWWVRVDGDATVLDDDEARDAAVEALVGKYWQYAQAPPSGPVVRVAISRVSGWTAET
jgi:PPOX class probable F420-dependent enzyme